VELLGVVFVADAPGRLPKPLRPRLELVACGAPRSWELPWADAWRLHNPHDPATPAPHLDTAPRTVREFAADLTALVPALRGGHYPTPGSAR
jgi:hypothetical protein